MSLVDNMVGRGVMTQAEAQALLHERDLHGYTGSHALDGLVFFFLVGVVMLSGFLLGWATDPTRR